MLKISVGGGLEINGLLVQALVKLKHFRPNWFYSDISVSSIYDSFYGLCWNG
ncbi:MAG: hypothetical protein LBE13_22460 [Bacteroidales bacterium]|nr:hypothetical protein [Bacteroidales bacterium]